MLLTHISLSSPEFILIEVVDDHLWTVTEKINVNEYRSRWNIIVTQMADRSSEDGDTICSFIGKIYFICFH